MKERFSGEALSGEVLGVLGGMGPLASAEFVRTVYDCCLGETEQQSPTVVMVSDPSVPDRTEALLGGGEEALLEGLLRGLNRLRAAGATRIVICCVTAHGLLARLPADLRGQIISLLDVTVEAVARAREAQLLVCTTGTRRLGLFQNHPEWDAIKDFIVWPDDADQRRVHDDLLYLAKRNRPVEELIPLVGLLAGKYGVGSVIAGCTEMHLLARHFAARGGRAPYRCVDPLTIIAEGWPAGPAARTPLLAAAPLTRGGAER